MASQKLLIKLIIYWLCWRLFLSLLILVAPYVLNYLPSFPYSQLLIESNLSKQVYSWANFDGVHYLNIAENGYLKTGLIQAFFPVYPFLINFVSQTGLHVIESGLIISNISLLGVLFLGYQLTKKWFNNDTANQFLLVLLLFPTSFYFGAVYTESLFLLLVLAGIWYYEQQKNLFSGLLMGLSSGVRLVGVALIPSFLLKWMKKSQLQPMAFKKIISKNWQFLIGLSIGSLVFVSYMYFLYLKFNDPLYFATVQSSFGAGRELGFISLPRVFFRSLKILLTARPFNLKYFSYAQDFLISIVVGLGIIFSFKKIKLQYVIFSIFAYLLPTLTGTLSSMPRYVLIIFPVIIWWSDYLTHHPRLKLIYYPISISLLIINTILFIQGYWVA